MAWSYNFSVTGGPTGRRELVGSYMNILVSPRFHRSQNRFSSKLLWCLLSPPTSLLRLPGMWIMVKKIFHPRFPFWEPGQQPLCLNADPTMYNVKDVVEETGLSDTRSAMSFHALTNPGRHFDTTPDDQRHLAEVLKNCPADKLQNFYDQSGFVLDSPLFINCISGHSQGQDSIVGLLLHTARYYCNGYRWACRCAKQMVLDRCERVLSDPARFPRVAAFMRETCEGM